MKNQVITDIYDLQNGYMFRDGFVFTSCTDPSNIYDAIVIRNPENANSLTPRKGISSHSLKDHIQYVNQNNIEKAVIIAENIDFISQCPSLKYLDIIPADSADNGFDFSPLYDIEEIKGLNCRTKYGIQENLYGSLDYSRVSGLVDLNICLSKSDLNYEKISTLVNLRVSNFTGKNRNLYGLFTSEYLEKLSMTQCKVLSLDGIEVSKKLNSLDISYLKFLENIDALSKVKETLKVLSIENCPKIQDFSVLNQLENLEHLELFGNNELPNLDFLNNMKKLKTFSFSMDVKDGDLSKCLNVSCVYSLRNRKHYNFKDKDLPKN